MREKRELIRRGVTMAVLLLVAWLIICYMLSLRPIIASEEALVLNEGDLAGWELSNTSDREGAYVWQTISTFNNSSVIIGSSMSIRMASYWTCTEAHLNITAVEDYLSRTVGNGLAPIDVGDEGFFFLNWRSVADPNGSYDIGDNGTMGRYTTAFANYLFRDGNVIIHISFETDGYSLDRSINYSQPWMMGIVEMQSDKVHENVLPLSRLIPREMPSPF